MYILIVGRIGVLVNGHWQKAWDPYQAKGEEGEFIRQTSSFRNWVTSDGSAGKTGQAGFKAESGRYHLYVALICPWASRTLMVRALKGLEHVISITVVEPKLTAQGWKFGAESDPLHNYEFIHQLYTHAAKLANGRATIPILWDKLNDTLVNNESADIIQMLNNEFNHWAKHDINLRPENRRDEMNLLNERLYHRLNNGVYQAGFAQSQSAYETATREVFTMLDELEVRLKSRKYLMGTQFTEVDVRLFVTLVRFDAVYYGLFKCNLRRLVEYPELTRYMRLIYTLPNIAQTVNLQHIKSGYYSVKDLNPNGIVPLGPETMVWQSSFSKEIDG